MIQKILKVSSIILLVILILVGGYCTKAYFSTEARLSKKYDNLIIQEINIQPDSILIELGKRLIVAKGCTDCHDKNLAGKVFIDDPLLGVVVAKNLTRGKGGIPADFSTKDWFMALRHGLTNDKKPLILMPSEEFALLSEKDLSAIIAYCDQLTPFDNELPKTEIGFLARVLIDLGELKIIPVELIDHSRELQTELVAEPTPQFGKYLSVACQGCHRENMKGGGPVAPGFPNVPDITSAGHPGTWTEAQFIKTLREGITPEGKSLDVKDMPWNMTQAYTEIELKALYSYLRSL